MEKQVYKNRRCEFGSFEPFRVSQSSLLELHAGDKKRKPTKRDKSTMPLPPNWYGLARLPKLESDIATIRIKSVGNIRVEKSLIRAVGRCTIVQLIKKFPRNWRETISLAFITRNLKPHLDLRARVDYIARRYLIERTGASIRQGRIVRIAKTNEELTLLAKLIVSTNEAKAKQLRFETTIDGTRSAVWQEIKSILGEALFTALETCDSVSDAVALASKTDGRGVATHWRKLATVRARIIRP